MDSPVAFILASRVVSHVPQPQDSALIQGFTMDDYIVHSPVPPPTPSMEPPKASHYSLQSQLQSESSRQVFQQHNPSTFPDQISQLRVKTLRRHLQSAVAQLS